MEIVGRAGLFLAGKVSPKLQGVEISISERGSGTPLITVATNELGAYRCHCLVTKKTQHGFVKKKRLPLKCRADPLPLSASVGPLHSDRQYDISASKEGFVLSPVEGTQGDFKAFALAGVTFAVRPPARLKLTLP